MGLQMFSFVDDDIVCKSPYLFAALWPVYIGIIVFSSFKLSQCQYWCGGGGGGGGGGGHSSSRFLPT
jgi:hypothetical protein